ncbi:PAS domain S-box protein [Zobellia roscoffensis]|uniref:PAS domain-containing sensor histidine kinase n=1 Tax=Zobellia roscoffensis TaxID=2779508 RepID=UPI00188C9FA2|nr:PAS domain S-box protein [Zobellia roscoffensis]
MSIENHQLYNTDIAVADLNAIARIGYWKFNIKTQEFQLDKVTYEILELPHGTPHKKKGVAFFQDKLQSIKQLITTSLKENIPLNNVLKLSSIDTSDIWVLLIGKRNSEHKGNIEISGLLQDITDRKKSENELSRKNELLDFTENKAGLGHWKWDLTMNLITCSENISRIIGTPIGTPVTIQKLTEGIHPEDLEYALQHLKNSVKNKFFKTLFHRFILNNGSERVIQVLGEPIFDDTDELTGFMCSSQDVTARKYFENELLKKNQLFLVAQKKIKFGYWQWDHKTNLVNCSENMSRFLNIEENTKFPLNILLKDVHPEDIDYVHACLNETVKTKLFIAFSHRIVRNDAIRYIKVNGKVNTDKNGNVLDVLGISQDVTDQKAVENKLLSKNQLLTFAEQISKIGHWQWNLITNTIDWSPNLYRIFELDVNLKIEFQTYFHYIHPDDRDNVMAKINKLRETKTHESVTHRIILANGNIKTIYLSATVTNIESGGVIEMVGTLQDVSEHRAEEIKFKGLLESAPNATLIIGKGNIIQMINKEAVNLFGYTSEELVGKSLNLLIPSRFDEKRKPARKKFQKNPKVLKLDLGEDFYMIDKSGKEIPVEATLGPLQNKGGLLISMAIRNITDEKLYQYKILNAKEELELLTKELTDQNHQLADFTQITSHNLRAPVSNLNSLLEIYKIMDDEEDRKELFLKFETVISHLTSTLNTLIEALNAKNNTAIDRREVSFSSTLIKTEEIFTAEILSTKAVIKSDFSEVDSIFYHKIYLESIFQNLVGNALKYKSDDRTPEIEIFSKINKNKVTLCFKDNGLGIDLKRHGHKVFGLNKVFHNHPEAKGIGLFMTKTQIEAMGGKIVVESKVNEGTTFSIHFN